MKKEKKAVGKWAGQIVKDYTIQGWTMDTEYEKYQMIQDRLYKSNFDRFWESGDKE